MHDEKKADHAVLRAISLLFSYAILCSCYGVDSPRPHRDNSLMVFPGQEFIREFRYVNTETLPLAIKSVKKSCSCLQLDIEKDRIEPGEGISVFATITASRSVGPHQVTIVCSLSDGVGEMQVTWACDYVVADYLILDPNPVTLTNEGGALGGEISTIRGSHPDKWHSVQAMGKTATSTYHVSMEKNASNEDWKLKIIGEPSDQDFGDFRDRIRLAFFDEGHKAMPHTQEFGLTIRKRGPWSAEPSQGLIGVVQLGKSSSIAIRLRPVDSGPFPRISKIEVRDAERVSCALGDGIGEDKILTVTFRGIGEIGPCSSEIVVEFDSGARLHIPYVASVTK